MVTNYVQHKHFFTPFSACGVLSSHFLPRPSSPLFF